MKTKFLQSMRAVTDFVGCISHNTKKSALSSAAVLAAMTITVPASQAEAGEVMTDRCSSRVSIPVMGYDAKPDTAGAVLLVPPASGYSAWTSPFTVKLSRENRVRWWCNSTKGNWLDPGTYRFSFDVPEGLRCAAQIGGQILGGNDVRPEDLRCISDFVQIKPGASAYDGWTPERSRCSNGSNRLRARMGPNRLLQIECLGKVAGTVEPLKTALKSFVPARRTQTACQRNVARHKAGNSLLPIINWYDAQRQDTALMYQPSWQGCEGETRSPNYRFSAIEGLVFPRSAPRPKGTIPLYHWYHHGTNDNLLATSLNFPGSANNVPNGYAFAGVAGYIYPPATKPTSAMVPLFTWYHPGWKDYLTTTSIVTRQSAGSTVWADYQLVRFEGYVLKAQ